MITDYEKKVISLLASEVLSSDQLDNVLRDGEIVGYQDDNGSGYFIHIRHACLPKERIVCHKPTVIGEIYNIACGFVIFIQDDELTIDCHSWGEDDIPEGFRN